MNPILDGLNDAQRKAVIQTEGPVLIIAGAGSGKTRVLTSRIAYLIYKGIKAENILALTFTRKAAREMKSRVSKMTDHTSHDLTMGTFHSVFAKILRDHSSLLGFPREFTIYDEDSSLSCIKTIIKETLFGANWQERKKSLSDDEKKRWKHMLNVYDGKKIAARISMLKNNMINPKMYKDDPEEVGRDSQNGWDLLGEIYQTYMVRCKRAGTMDYDDLLLYMSLLLHKYDDIREILSDRFRYILVDEYQDTNTVQWDILRSLTKDRQNICVVGDDSQSIYSFRGAKVENILQFRHAYEGVSVFRLETNYRSTPIIVEASNRLISHNLNRLEKTCRAAKASNNRIDVITLNSDRDEAAYVVQRIKDMAKENMCPLSDFAILYRTNAQARVFEDCFMRERVPYRVYSGTSFFNREEIKDAMAYCRLVVNPNDDEAFKRICNKPARGVSDASVAAMESDASFNETSIWDIASGRFGYPCGIKQKGIEHIKAFREMIGGLQKDTAQMDAFEAAKTIMDKTGLIEYYKCEKGDDGVKKSHNIEEFLVGVQYYVDDQLSGDDLPAIGLNDYLTNAALLSNADTADEEAGRVSLMTAHCAKGLEFPTVFVVGSEDSLFPHYNTEDNSYVNIEEERRLYYVAITRAMDNLVITKCLNRCLYGAVKKMEPSRFIKEMDLDQINPTANTEVIFHDDDLPM